MFSAATHCREPPDRWDDGRGRHGGALPAGFRLPRTSVSSTASAVFRSGHDVDAWKTWLVAVISASPSPCERWAIAFGRPARARPADRNRQRAARRLRCCARQWGSPDRTRASKI